MAGLSFLGERKKLNFLQFNSVYRFGFPKIRGDSRTPFCILINN